MNVKTKKIFFLIKIGKQNKKLLALKGDRLELESKEEEEKKKKEKPWETEQWVRAAQD